MISLCFATRGRPEIYKQMCQSALDLADNPDNIEFISYHDNDDLSVYEYIGHHKEVIGPGSGENKLNIIQMANECQKIATGPIYMFGADDIVFLTKGWDKRVLEEFEKFEDKIALVCPDSIDWGIWKYGTMGFLHKNWIDATGYFLCPIDGAQVGDRWLNDVAMGINRRVHMLDVKTHHNNVRDHVHRRKNRQGRNEQWTKKYWLPKVVEVRERDIRVLKEYIENFKL